MILFNLDKLLLTVKALQERGDAKQSVTFDEDSLDLLVKLLQSNEQNGELVTKIYEVLLHTVEISEHTTSLRANITVLDMSKNLLQICIKHSSIYQCEQAFQFLSSLVMTSEKYQNKQDIQLSLSKIMPTSLRKKE
jgi:hypothetical protein